MSDTIVILGTPPTRVSTTENMMPAMEDAAEQFFGQGELSGFTLFEHRGRGWQMSVRPKGEAGWIVKVIPDEQARAILSQLEHDPRFAAANYGRGPGMPAVADQRVENQARRDELAYLKAAEEARRAHTAAIRALMPQ